MMKSLLRFARCRIPGLHPAMDELVAWAEYAMEARSAMHIHFDRCSRCRHHAGLIRRSMESAAAREPGALETRMLDQVYRDLQMRMRAWSLLSGLTSSGRVQRFRNPANQRVTHAIEIYFGREAASRIASAVDNRGPDQHLAPTVKPLFSAFLGVKAADALAHRLVGSVV